MKSFQYTVPARALPNLRRRTDRTVKAWKTKVPGLIVQTGLAFTVFHLTHEASGFIVQTYPDREKAAAASKQLESVPIDWSVREGREVLRQCIDLSEQHRLVMESALRKRHVSRKRWRAVLSRKSTKRWWNSYFKSRKA